MKPKESIRSAAETPITWLGRLAPLAAGGAGARLPGLRLSAGTDGLLDLPASCPPLFPAGLTSTLSPFSKKGKKKWNKKSLLVRVETVLLLRMVPLPSPAWGQVKNGN